MRAKARFMLTESPAVRTGVEQVLKQDFEGCEQVSPAPDTPKSSGTSAVRLKSAVLEQVIAQWFASQPVETAHLDS